MRPFKFRRPAQRAYILACFVALYLGIFSGCGGEPTSSTPARPLYVVTIPPLGAFLQPIVEGRADVVVIVPPGASEHTYELKPADARAAADATALMYLDDSLDGWAARIEAQQRIRLIDAFPKESIRHYAAGDGDEHGTLDPHIWLDPVAVRAALPQIAAVLSQLDPGGADKYQKNADAFSVELATNDKQLAALFATMRGRAVLQFHPSLYYFLDRYGIETAGVIETIAGQEPSPKAIKQLADLVREKHIKVIVTEPQLADAPVRALAEATGARVAHMDPLGGMPGRETYSELLWYNARALAEAFP